MDIILVNDSLGKATEMKDRLELLQSDWTVRLVADGPSALNEIHRKTPDVIISDLSKSRKDATEFWGEVDRLSPSAFRVALSNDADDECDALSAPSHTHRVVAKPVEPKELASIIIDGVFLLRHLEDESLRTFVASVGQLPKPTEKLQLVLDMIGDPNVSLSDFQSLLEEEPVLAASIMRIANTPFFGGGKTSNLFDAVQGMGLNVVQAVLVGELARSSVSIPKQSLPVLERIIEGSQDSMVSCLRLFRDFYRRDCSRGDAITACLLQDIGKLVFLSCRSEDYLELVSECDRGQENIVELERRRFGCDHAQLGALLLNLWGIPESIVGAVALHHHFGYVSAHPISLPGLLFMGSQRALYGSQSPDLFFAFREDEDALVGIDAEVAQAVLDFDD